MTTPLHFGPPAGRLFGVHQAPAGAAPRALGVVLCYPIGQEYLRAHRSFRQLAIRLARHGFHVLGFDYYGCGDSSGPDEAWTVPGALAKRRAGRPRAPAPCRLSRVGLVGLRFGATLALLAARGDAGRRGARPLGAGVERTGVPAVARGPADGVASVDGTRRGSGGGETETELMGFPLPPVARAGVEEIDLLTVDRCPAERVLLLMEGTSATAGDGSRSA